MNNLNLTFFPNDKKISSRTGQIPIYLRVRVDEHKAEGKTMWSVTPEERTFWNEHLQRINLKSSKLNEYLNKIESRFNDLKILYAYSTDEIDAKQIRDKILGRKIKGPGDTALIDFIENYYSTALSKSNRYSEGTKKNYRKAIRHLKNYLAVQRQENIPISKLSVKFAQDFTFYLMSDDVHNGRKGMSEVSACGIVKKYKTILNNAVDQGLIDKNPFNKIKLSYRSPEKQKISKEQFVSLLRPEVLNETERAYTLSFLFMCSTGMAYQDFQNLTSENLEKSEIGIKLTYQRSKTGHYSEQYLTDLAIDLLEIFSTRPDVQNSSFLVPQVTNQQFNRTLKVIGAKIKVPFNITTHHGRHTFRWLLDEANIVDPTVIKKLMGWSSNNSIDSVYRNVTDTRLLKTRDQLNELIIKL